MQYGVVFPQYEIGTDPAAIKDYTQTAEDLGFSHIMAYEHVLGANPDRPGGWSGPYTYEHAFYDPFVLFAYMAGFTSTLGFVTGILILPQRQTALVANQAATLDVLCGGRFRLGIGVGWNKVEYDALGEDFSKRGRRSSEQIDLLKQLFTEPLVTFDGEFDQIDDAGISPLPVQQPIPIWIGGQADAALQRLAYKADGWLPFQRSMDDAKAKLEVLDRYLAEAGRSRADIGIEPRIPFKAGPAGWAEQIDSWGELGATHISLSPLGAGLDSPQVHIDALRQFADAIF
ncbi:MAG: LLM class F420-dependent oxidoreductase [Chloroflexi bacterium]|nr:LLM class F420-dependent oxidoreductase [Chloroflexota bacterium]